MPARILIVEDNPTNLALMAYLLRAFGHDVLTAENGQEALDRLRPAPPDLVLLDLQMPRMDGYETVRRIKSDPSCAAIPVLAVTAFAMVGDRDRILRSGFDGYLPKPIDPETFVRDVDKSLPPDLRSTGSVAAHQSSTPSDQPPPSPRLKHATILAVDDSAINLKLLVASLEPLGYDVLTTQNVGEAMELARQRRPDVILSDLQMPNQSGYDFLRLAKADDQVRRVPFVLLSARMDTPEEHETARALGAARFISRPIPVETLALEIDACVRDLRGEGGHR